MPLEAYAPWWQSNWTADLADVSFAADGTLYALKATEGLWRMTFELDPPNHTYRCLATAYYPGVTCGMNYTLVLQGWANPDIPTLHHPYGVVADGDTAYVSGSSGKVQRLTPEPDAGVRLQSIEVGGGQVALQFASSFDNRTHEVEATINLNPQACVPRPDAFIRRTAEGIYQAACSLPNVPAQFNRVHVRPRDQADYPGREDRFRSRGKQTRLEASAVLAVGVGCDSLQECFRIDPLWDRPCLAGNRRGNLDG